jgi:YHS domain-containing protein
MSVDIATGTHVADHDGTRYYFCSAGCRATFLNDPGRYAASPVIEAADEHRMLNISPIPTGGNQ